MAEGFSRRENNKINELKAGAWYTALWTRIEARNFPKFKDIIQNDAKPQKKQTPEQMLEMCKILNAAYGGEVVEA